MNDDTSSREMHFMRYLIYSGMESSGLHVIELGRRSGSVILRTAMLGENQGPSSHAFAQIRGMLCNFEKT